MAKIKRSQIKHFVNTTTTTGAVYSLLGVGVTTTTPAMNPKTTEETYVHQDTATITIDSYAPTMPVEMTPDTTDAVFQFIDAIRKNRKTLSEAQTDIVEVRLYETSSGNAYPATKQTVSVQIDEGLGGDGGVPAKIKFTFNYIGDPTQGSFNVSTLAFS